MEKKGNSNSKKKRSRKKRKQQELILKASLVGALAVILAVILFFAFKGGSEKTQNAGKDAETQEEQKETDEKSEEEQKAQQRQTLIAQADLQAAQYDYDAAMATLNSIEGAAEDQEIQQKLAEIQQTKDSCVPVNMDEVTHIFYHSLVVDPEKGFAGNDSVAAGFKQWMTTVDEFNSINNDETNSTVIERD